MPRLSARWLEIAREQFDALPLETQRQVDARIEELLEQPEESRDAYESRSDQWTTTYGDGSGLILYAVVREHQMLLVLRLV